MDFFEQFMPHGACFLWNLDILLPFFLGELFTFISYISIPVSIFILLPRGLIEDSLKPMATVYCLFILFCGIGHALNIINIWNGFYRFSAWWSVLTGLISIMAALCTIYLSRLYLRILEKRKMF